MAKFDSGLYHGTLGSPQSKIAYDPKTRNPGLPADPGSPPDQPDEPERLESPSNPTRDALLAEAKTPEARRIINELYHGAGSVGDGGTADVIREERATGRPVGDRFHSKKGQERINQINRILRRNPNHPDRALLERLRDDLSDALGGN